jgi:signal transduction histidine kinase
VMLEHEALIAKRGQELARDLSPETGRVAGDAKPLRAAIALLLGSAIADTPEGGRILVYASGTADSATLVVSDNGPGAGPDAKMLAKVGALVESAGGRVTSMAEPGEGTVVQISLTR